MQENYIKCYFLPLTTFCAMKDSFHPFVFCRYFVHAYSLGMSLIFLLWKSCHPFLTRALIELTYFSLMPFFFHQKCAELTAQHHATTRHLLWIQISERSAHGYCILVMKDMIFPNSFLKICIYLQICAQSHKGRKSRN